MTPEASREFLDRLEKHVLQPQFRYDHQHKPGDVTIWNNYMSLHNSPPIKTGVKKIEDARLMYRLSCKGEPSLTLPRDDEMSWITANIPGNYRSPENIVGKGSPA